MNIVRHTGLHNEVIAVIGGESTGKTTLAEAVAKSLHGVFVPEFARQYAIHVNRPLSSADVDLIARGEIEVLTRAMDSSSSKSLVCDTDLVSTAVYAEHYYGNCPRWIHDEVRARRADLYLLCEPDLAWVPDGIRDLPLERWSIHEEFQAYLAQLGASFLPVYGKGVNRLAVALAAVRGFRASRA